jgi:hypothetical protein
MAKSAIDSMADYMADPMETAQAGQDQIMKGLESNNYTAKGAAFGSILGRSLNGGMDPATQKAAAEQSAVKETMANLAPKGDQESDLDYQIRQSGAIYNTVSPHDPQMAMRVADHIATLSEARSQQKSLEAKTAETEDTNATRQITQGTFVVADKNGNNMATVSRFMPGPNGQMVPNPKFAEQLQQALADNPGSTPVTSEKFEGDKRALQVMRDNNAQQLALIRAQAKAALGDVPDDVLKGWVEKLATRSATLRNATPAERDAIIAYQYSHGIHESDLASAYNEQAGLHAEATSEGRRLGNISTISLGLTGLIKNVNDAAAGLNRTDMRALNSAIIGGKTAFSDPKEQAYATAVQGLITDYSRVMSSGVGQTSDSSRDHARDLLPLNSSKAAMQASMNMMQKEVDVIKNAGDEALQVTANPQRYKALMKIQKALWGEEKGGGLIDFDSKSATPTSKAYPGPAPVGGVTPAANKTVAFSDLPAG